jgi:predicted RNA-binding protein YlqC (UPF0109 family)
MREAIEKIVKAMVANRDAVEVNETAGERATVISVKVAESDMGKLIGREGRTIKALRGLLFAAGEKNRKRYVLDVVEDKAPRVANSVED